ncbi:HD domain-containing protein 2 [Seminavis robusta]|uniref:HD domain-containing protein 2 n=1 Tax=Seminavis robusta TaxID=568900 RepID=A0A9N8DRB5_9STRA|nr:HD domain-containing protein 2 [Seminavis robusta]|eukprot:Sro232_g094020.1 HD domain-containing protein 2 (284) ;mRNA; f:73182-74033
MSTSGLSDGLSFISDICGALKKLKRTGWVKHQIPLPESDSDHMHRCAMCALLVGQPADRRDQWAYELFPQYHPSKVDTTKLLRMAVTHDLCEALAGDITPFCDPSLVESKHDKEDQAMAAIQKVVAGPLGQELYDLWKEYEAQTTVEAIYCKDIDKFEMVVQAFEYEKEHLMAKGQVDKKPAAASSSSSADEPPPAKKLKLEGVAANPPTIAATTKHRDVRKDVSSEPLRGFFVSTNRAIKTPLFRRLDRELRERRRKVLAEKGWEVDVDEEQIPLPPPSAPK